MGLPDIIARIDIPEREDSGREAYRIFREMVLTGADVYQNYTLTTGKGHYDKHGGFVLEDTGHIEHIHHYDREKEKTGRLLASIRTEGRFGRTHYIVEVYDRGFAEEISRRFGTVEYVRPERREDAIAKR